MVPGAKPPKPLQLPTNRVTKAALAILMSEF